MVPANLMDFGMTVDAVFTAACSYMIERLMPSSRGFGQLQPPIAARVLTMSVM